MNTSTRTSLWAFLLIAGIMVVACILLWDDEWDRGSKEGYVDLELLDKVAVESPQLVFGPEDVVVSHGWSVLSGLHPAVKFHCRYNSRRKEVKFAMLCYRHAGASQWQIVETHLRRDKTARVTLRDLKRGSDYECFFLLIGDDFLLRSKKVTFSMGRHVSQASLP